MEINRQGFKGVDLSRPREGQPNCVRLANGIRYVKVISKRFTCPRCRTFCGELTPVIDKGMREVMRRHKMTLSSPELQVKVYCFSMCHEDPGWGWDNFEWTTKEKNEIREWPDEWKVDEYERKMREERDKR